MRPALNRKQSLPRAGAVREMATTKYEREGRPAKAVSVTPPSRRATARGSGEPFALGRGADLGARLGRGRLAVADVRAVPAGRYAKEALESLALWAQVSERLAITENVRAALVLAARGEVPLAIVYETDARADARVQVVARFPQGSHRPIRYPAALVRGHAGGDAIALLRFLRSPAAARVFGEHGFAAPD